MVQQSNGRAFVFLTELKLAYSAAGKPLSDQTLCEVARRLSESVPCEDAEIVPMFARAKDMADVPTQRTLVRALEQIRDDIPAVQPQAQGEVEFARLWERCKAFEQLQNFCYRNGMTEQFFYATEKIDGKWAHPYQLEKLKSYARNMGFRYVPDRLPRKAPPMQEEERRAAFATLRKEISETLTNQTPAD